MLRRGLSGLLRGALWPPDLAGARARDPDLEVRLVEGLTAPDAAFPRWLTRHLCQSLDVAYAFVGELCGDDWRRVRTLAVSRAGNTADNFEYDLRRASFADPLVTDVRCCPRGAAARHPHDDLLVTLGADGYAVAPLADAAGRPLGLIAVTDMRPLAWPDQVTSTLVRFRPRTAGVLEARRALRERELIIEATTQPSSDDIFRSLVTSLAHAQHVSIAFVSELLRHKAHTARTLAICRSGELQENFEYDLRGTPCGLVYERSVVFHPRGVQRLYPEDHYLAEVGAEAYMGISFFDASGDPIGHLGIIHDRPLTDAFSSQPVFRVFASRAGAELERRWAEERRLAMDRKLLEAERSESLALLAGGIAHDFNNLLVGIAGNVSLALASCPRESPLRPYLEEIETSAQRTADLSRQMLAYSGRARLVLESVDLSALVGEVLQLIRASLPKQVVVEHDLAQDLPRVTVDATQLRQLVMNLVLNAAEAIGEDHGTVAVRSRLAHVDPGDLAAAVVGRDIPPGDYLALEVMDSGCGMEPGTRERIFEPFFTTKSAGRGLGLAAVQGIVRGHRGALTLASVPGEGSVFTLLLPVGPEPAVGARPSRAATEARQGGGLVLVVDDEACVRETAGRMVRRLGFEVELAAGGREAVETLHRLGSRVSAVLLDMSMPGMDGEETCRELRRLRPDVPVILMSGYSGEEVTKRFSGEELVGFLQKPFRLDELRRHLEGVARPDEET